MKYLLSLILMVSLSLVVAIPSYADTGAGVQINLETVVVDGDSGSSSASGWGGGNYASYVYDRTKSSYVAPPYNPTYIPSESNLTVSEPITVSNDQRILSDEPTVITPIAENPVEETSESGFSIFAIIFWILLVALLIVSWKIYRGWNSSRQTKT